MNPYQIAGQEYYYWHSEPCECCDQGPVIFDTCQSCHRLLGICGEVDYVAYYFAGTTRRPVANADTAQSRPLTCPFCGGAIHYATFDELIARGFPAAPLQRQKWRI